MSTGSIDSAPPAGVRESETLSLLLAQIEQIGERLTRLEAAVAALRPDDDTEASDPIWGAPDGVGNALVRGREIRPPLPEPRIVRAIIRNRQIRKQHISGRLFSDPAWDMLLDLTVAYAEHARISITSLCIASGVPQATALRWINLLVGAGLVQRVEDIVDRRRVFVALTEEGANTMAALFSDLERVATPLI
jgi:DNA-binding MarR family transcriptional regulator